LLAYFGILWSERGLKSAKTIKSMYSYFSHNKTYGSRMFIFFASS
jgi:hypothetical protein